MTRMIEQLKKNMTIMKKNDAEKEAECPVHTPPVDMEEGVG